MVFYELVKTSRGFELQLHNYCLLPFYTAARIIPTHLYYNLTFYTTAIFLSSAPSQAVWDFDVLYK